MSWVIGIGILVLLAIGALVLWPHSDVSQESLPDVVRNLLVRYRNGAFYRLDDKTSGFWFSMERFEGDDLSATFALRIPRHERTITATDELKQAFLSNGLDWVEEVDNPSLLAVVFVPVDNIWDKSSGARGAHAVRILLEKAGLSPNTKLKLDRQGKPSDRFKYRDASDL